MNEKKAFLLPRLGKKEIPNYFYAIQKDIRKLLVLRPWRFFLALITNWLIILTAISLWLLLENFWLLPVAMLIIGTRQHALAILMHEGAHGNIIRNRKWNNRIAKWFLAWPIGISFENYKYVHMKHHLHMNEEQDPDWNFLKDWHDLPAPKSFYIKLIAKFLLGYGFIESMKFQRAWHQANPKASYLGGELWINLSLISLLVYGLFAGQWTPILYFFSLWVAPLGMVAYPCNVLRAMMEHYSFEGRSPEERSNRLINSRSVAGSLLEKVFLIPHNVGFHLEHHIYDKVPYYNLEKLSAILQEQDDFVAIAPVYKSYFGQRGSIGELFKKAE
ncbi:MAG: fatty acid desaturase family protein [Oligoflexus sp.]